MIPGHFHVRGFFFIKKIIWKLFCLCVELVLDLWEQSKKHTIMKLYEIAFSGKGKNFSTTFLALDLSDATRQANQVLAIMQDSTLYIASISEK
jgi:predicted glycosyltransferase